MEARDKYTLGLELPSDPRWAAVAEMHIEDILVVHTAVDAAGYTERAGAAVLAVRQ